MHQAQIPLILNAAHKHREINKGDQNSVSYKSDRSFRCHECGGFGHYQAKYPTFLKRKKNSFTVTLSMKNHHMIVMERNMAELLPDVQMRKNQKSLKVYMIKN